MQRGPMWRRPVKRSTLAFTLLPWLGTVAVTVAEPSTPRDRSADQIDRILTQLEQRSDGLKDIRTKVVFVEEDRINLTVRKKFGEILFLITEPNPHFLIHFERTETDGLLGKREWYLFDGRWLYQAIERIQQVTKQEIAKPGEEVDLFDLETAPFPLPFGQKKEDILTNFAVTLSPRAADDPENTDHLICIPKPQTRLHGKYDRLEFYIHRKLHLPSRVVVTKNEGLEINRADFPGLAEKSINAGVKETDFRKPALWKKYEMVVEKLPPDEKRTR